MGLFVAKFRKTLKASACALIVLFVVPKDFNQSAGPSAADQATITLGDEFDFYESLVLIGDAQNSVAPMGSDIPLYHRPKKPTGRVGIFAKFFDNGGIELHGKLIGGLNARRRAWLRNLVGQAW